AGACGAAADSRLAAHPAAEEYDQKIVGGQPPVGIVAEDLVDVQEPAPLRLAAGLFANFAQGGIPCPLAWLDVAAGQAPETAERPFAALDQQNLRTAKDGGTGAAARPGSRCWGIRHGGPSMIQAGPARYLSLGRAVDGAWLRLHELLPRPFSSGCLLFGLRDFARREQRVWDLTASRELPAADFEELGMSYKGRDLDLRTPHAPGVSEDAAGQAGWSLPMPGRDGPIPVDQTVLACCNAAYDAALFHGARDVRVEHVLYALTRVDAARDILEQHGVRTQQLRRDAAS